MIRWLILAIALIALLVAPRGETSQPNTSSNAVQEHHAATQNGPGAF